MKAKRLKQGFMMVPIILALGMTNVAAARDPLFPEGKGRLFELSIEELMELSIDHLEADLRCDGDALEASVRQTMVGIDTSYPQGNSHVAHDKTTAAPISIAWDSEDDES